MVEKFMETNKKDHNVVAIIPARGGSKGIPRKNVIELGGKPLILHTIEQAQSTEIIDLVVVSSEDSEIIEIAERSGAMVLKRSEQYASDSAQVDPLLIITIKELEERGFSVDIVVLLYPTAPLREVESINSAVRMVRDDEYDSVLSLYEDKSYLWQVNNGTAIPINYDPAKRMPRQKENWNQWVENKAVYVMTRDLIMNTGCRIGGRVGYIEMPKYDSMDLDSIEDLLLVRALYSIKMNDYLSKGVR